MHRNLCNVIFNLEEYGTREIYIQFGKTQSVVTNHFHGSPNATKVHHISYFSTTLPSTKSYVVGTHLNGLIKMIQNDTNKIGLS